MFNNKGKSVRQFEPFFTATHRFESDVRAGVSPILFYDPVARVIATLHPNHTWQKVVFDPWRQESWDVNDTVLEPDPKNDPDVGDFFSRLPDTDYLPTWYASRINGANGIYEQTAARKSELHANTPAIAHTDSLGRTFLTVAQNKFERKNNDGSVETIEAKYSTRVVLDIEGNQLEVIDAKDRAVMHYDYDMLGSQIHSVSMDAGERWMLNDVAGQPIRAWDARDHEFRTEYDRLRRPLNQFVRGTDANESDPRVLNRDVLFGKIEYGEGQANDVGLNLRTRPFRSYDNAGILTSEKYDFKGNLLRGMRQLATDYKSIPDWAGAVALEPEVFASSTTYDALNRVISLIAPDNSEIKPTYNEANLLELVRARIRGAADWTTFVEDIDYNAKGQRELIEYGNGVQTTYDYDPLTFRLINLKTTRDSDGDLQNLSYIYDPSGNITYIKDAAQQTIYFANTQVTPDADYVYDAINQLIRATGREHIGQMGQVDHNDPDIHPLPHPNNVEAMRPYTESYEYDAVGNILAMIHQANGGSWTRYYQYPADSNRLLTTSLPGDDPNGPYTGEYKYDLHGSMTFMPHLPLVTWDFAERMQTSSTQVFGEGTPETTYYVYDASGQRVRKVTERQAATIQTPTRMKERIYVGGFEIYREYQTDGTTTDLERQTLHIMDGQQRIALVETKTVDASSALAAPVSLMRYQLGNHLGSASLELDETAQIISYEEYHPYGTTSYRATDSAIEVSPKRYLYTGKEKDEETGLYYHGARYYLAWLGRWTSLDPGGIDDGLNLYRYVRNNSVKFVDPNGKAAWEKKRDWDPATDAEKYRTFVHEEYARLRQETEGKEPTVFNRYDCADLAMRFYVRYAAREGLEIRFYNPHIKQEVSSSDSNLRLDGIRIDQRDGEDAVKLFEIYMRTVLKGSDLREQGLVTNIEPGSAGAGDLMMTPIHVQIPLSELKKSNTESDGGEVYSFTYLYGSGSSSSKKFFKTGIPRLETLSEGSGTPGIEIKKTTTNDSRGRCGGPNATECGETQMTWENFVFRWSDLIEHPFEPTVNALLSYLPLPSMTPSDMHFYLHLSSDLPDAGERDEYQLFLRNLSEEDLLALSQGGNWNKEQLYSKFVEHQEQR